jgi:hypothetical protein
MWCPGQGSPTKASPSRSLRSVKGIIGRKTPQNYAEPIPSDMTGVQTGNVSTSSTVVLCVLLSLRPRVDARFVNWVWARRARTFSHRSWSCFKDSISVTPYSNYTSGPSARLHVSHARP